MHWFHRKLLNIHIQTFTMIIIINRFPDLVPFYLFTVRKSSRGIRIFSLSWCVSGKLCHLKNIKTSSFFNWNIYFIASTNIEVAQSTQYHLAVYMTDNTETYSNLIRGIKELLNNYRNHSINFELFQNLHRIYVSIKSYVRWVLQGPPLMPTLYPGFPKTYSFSIYLGWSVFMWCL